jgi:hypothetical protein
MKAVITMLAIVVTSIIACDTPEGTTTSPSDSTTINSNRPDSTMQRTDTTQNTDTTVRRDSVPNL